MTKTMDNIQLRLETPSDYQLVEALTREAFWDVFRPGCVEHLILHQLRNSKAFIPELDYVAIKSDKIIGSIVYSKARVIDKENKTYELLTMGPFSVFPTEQRKGVGSRLLISTLELAGQMGYKGVVIFGNPQYYCRFGFRPAIDYRITPSDGEPCDACLAIELTEDGLNGVQGRFYEDDTFHYQKELLEQFDKQFHFKEKHTFDSQLFKE